MKNLPKACLHCPNTYFSNATSESEKSYPSITYEEICGLLLNPMHFEKAAAPFFIPSNYLGHDGRTHDAQRKKGQFWYLTLDIDRNNLAADVLQLALVAVIGNARYMMHSTSSAKPEARKWRVLVPLAVPVEGVYFEETQDALFDLLEVQNDQIVCDRALARTGQPIYLPNIPPKNRDAGGNPFFYEHYTTGDQFLVLGQGHPIVEHRDRIQGEALLLQEEIERDRQIHISERASKAQKTGGTSPIEIFNKTNPIASLFDKYGYIQNGHRDIWQSPYQTSNSFAVKDFRTYWVSHSESDLKAGVGKPKVVLREVATGRLPMRGGRYSWGDAFDLFVHFEHKGDFDMAMQATLKSNRQAQIPRLDIAAHMGAPLSDTDLDTAALADGVPLTATLLSANLNSAPDQLLSGETAKDAEGPADLSDDQLALDLGTAGFDQDARHVKAWGKWFFWNGCIWVSDEKNAAMTQIRKFLRVTAANLNISAEERIKMATSDEEKKSAEKYHTWVKMECLKVRSSRTVAALHGLAASNSASAASPEQFDNAPYLLATPVGTLDLKKGELGPANREDYLTKSAAVSPAGVGAAPQLWLTFLDTIFAGDRDLISFVQRIAGYALTGSNREHKLLFFYGTGRNGKSVLLNTLMGILGPYARRVASNVLLEKTHEGHPTEIAGLHGARLVVGSEMPAGKNWNEAVVKDLTGGDVITARRMRQDFFDFTPQFTLIIAGNNQPKIREVDEAMRARICLVPFEVTIPEEERDPELEAKLKEEWPAILRWCIDGCLQWQAQGLNPPKKVIAASKEYLENEDLIGRYLEEQTTVAPEGRVTNEELRLDFSSWLAQQGLQGWSQSALTKAINKSGRYESFKSGKTRGFKGLKLVRKAILAEIDKLGKTA